MCSFQACPGPPGWHPSLLLCQLHYFGVSKKLAEGTLDPTVYVICKDIEEHWFQNRPLEDNTRDQPPLGHRAIDNNPLTGPSNQFFIHLIVQLSNPHLSSLEINTCCKTLSHFLRNSYKKTEKEQYSHSSVINSKKRVRVLSTFLCIFTVPIGLKKKIGFTFL